MTDPIRVFPWPSRLVLLQESVRDDTAQTVPPQPLTVQPFFPPTALTSLLLTVSLVTGVWKDSGGDTVGTQYCPSHQGTWVSFLQVGPVQLKLVIIQHKPLPCVHLHLSMEMASLTKQISQVSVYMDL